MVTNVSKNSLVNHLYEVLFVCVCIHVILSLKTLKLGFLISLKTTMVNFVFKEAYPFHQSVYIELHRIIHIILNYFLVFNTSLSIVLEFVLYYFSKLPFWFFYFSYSSKYITRWNTFNKSSYYFIEKIDANTQKVFHLISVWYFLVYLHIFKSIFL